MDIERALDVLIASGLEPQSMTLYKQDWDRLLFSLKQKHKMTSDNDIVPVGMYSDFFIYRNTEIWKGDPKKSKYENPELLKESK